MKKISSEFFAIFCILFLLFTLAFMFYWNSAMTQEGGVVSNWMNRTTALLGAFCLIIYVAAFKRRINGIHLVCLLWIIIMPFIMLFNYEKYFVYFQTMLWPLVFEVTYLMCVRNIKRDKSLRFLLLIIAIIGIVFFLLTRIDIYRTEHTQTNTIYFSFLTLPWLLYGRKPKSQLVVLFVFTFLVLLSMKRSAMLAMAAVWLFYVIEKIKKTRNIIYAIAIFAMVIIGIDQLYDRINQQYSGELVERITREETDEGSNRLGIWVLTWSMIENSSVDGLIVGHGHFGVRNDSSLEISAHNDFMEVIYDYGIFIFILYLCLWVYVIRRCIFLYRKKSALFLPYATSLSIFLVLSFVSHLILYTSYFNFLVMFWGMSEALVMPYQVKAKIVESL